MPAFAAAGQQISFSSINTRLGRSATSPISLGDSELRTTAKAIGATAQISIFNNVSGAARTNLVISSNTTGYDLKAQCDADGYSAGKSYITVTINSEVYIGGNGGVQGTYSTSSWAFNVAGFSDGDRIVITNNGNILGQGGNGGGSGLQPGGMGGNAMRIGFPGVTVINNGTISGGGGGGAGGGNSSARLGSPFSGGRYDGYGIGGKGGGGAGYPAGTGVIGGTVTTTSRGGTATAPSSADGTTLTGGLGSAAVGFGTPGAGASGGNIAQPGGTTSLSFPFFGPGLGYPGYGPSPAGYGGNAGWGIYYDTVSIQNAVIVTNNATISALGYGGIYG
jgi:hypothetical protein